MDASRVALLTEGEKACLRLVGGGYRSKEIGPQLGISHHTVDERIKKALRKLGATDRIAAARLVAAGDDGHQPLVHQPAALPLPDQRPPEPRTPSEQPETIGSSVAEDGTEFVFSPQTFQPSADRGERQRPAALSPLVKLLAASLVVVIGIAGTASTLRELEPWITDLMRWLDRIWS